MKRFVEGVDRGQSTLFPASLDDYVTEDNPVRAVDVFVDGLDLDKLGFMGVQPLDTGRPSYHPGVMLKPRAASASKTSSMLQLRTSIAVLPANDSRTASQAKRMVRHCAVIGRPLAKAVRSRPNAQLAASDASRDGSTRPFWREFRIGSITTPMQWLSAVRQRSIRSAR